MPHACQQPDSEGGQYVRLTALHWHLAEQQTSNRRKQQLLDNNQQKIAVSTMCGKNLHRIKSNLEGSAALVYLGIGSRHKPPVRNELCGLCIHETNEGCVYFLFFASHFCVHNMSHLHITFMLQHHQIPLHSFYLQRCFASINSYSQKLSLLFLENFTYSVFSHL